MAVLENGSQVGVVGGGPAGSFFASFLLETARWLGLEVAVDVFEPRDLTRPGPSGCNMCGGVVSESLLQTLAAEGLLLPKSIQRQGIDSYVLHTAAGRAIIQMPLGEKRIVAVYRGGGPAGTGVEGEGLDAYLLSCAQERGATVWRERVEDVGYQDGKPVVLTNARHSRTYDLLVGAVGVNNSSVRLFERMGFGYTAPAVSRAYACEFSPGKGEVRARLGSSFHVFLLDIPGADFGALIPKGEHVTLCIVGENVTSEAAQRFIAHPEVAACVAGAEMRVPACRCSPRLSVGPSGQPFGERVVVIGDCATTRLFKDGLGAAYRTAKAAAVTALMDGISAEAFRDGYWPTCRDIAKDNVFGKTLFRIAHHALRLAWPHRALLRMVESERRSDGSRRILSRTLWDVFTGSARYRDLVLRAARPRNMASLFRTFATG